MNRPNEEEQLTMVVENLLLVYHKYLFAQYFPNFKALIAVGTQIEDAISNETIKNKDVPKFKRNFGPSSSKTVEVSNMCIYIYIYIYIKLIHTNLLPQCKYHKGCVQGLGGNFMNFIRQ